MVSNKKWLGLAVVIGVAAGVWLALNRAPKQGAADAVVAAPTNAVAHIAVTNAIVSEAEKRGGGEQSINRLIEYSNNRMNESSTSNLQPAKSPRKPIANDPKIPKERQVLLANRRIAVEKGRSFPKKFCQEQTPTARGTAPYVVISELPVSRDVRIQAVANGAKVVGFLPNNALLVEADAQALKNLEDDVLFTAAVEYEPTDKIQRAVMEGERGEGGEKIEATIVLLNPKDRDAIQKFVTDNGGTLLDGLPPSEKSVGVKMPRRLVEKLAGKAEVKWIERRK